MNPVRALCAALLMMCAVSLLRAQSREIVGYYPSWKWKAPAGFMNPSQIPFDKLTIINYAFFIPRADGTLIGKDSAGDRLILQGEWAGKPGRVLEPTTLTDCAHEHGVKVMLSLGGWDDSDIFPEIAADSVKRGRFAHSCVEQIQRYGFDGIDLDWEYPGYAGHRGTAGDRANFTLLVREVKDSLRAYERIAGVRYFLTAALPASPILLAGYEMDEIVRHLDMINIMTYDYNGPWSPVSGHNAPLFGSTPQETTGTIDATLKYYTAVLNVPREKLNLGIPFYGHSYANCRELFTSHTGEDTVHFGRQGLFYSDIVRMRNEFERRWDAGAKVPTLVNLSWNVLVSYDDEESVSAKSHYVIDQGVRGVIIWEITGDRLPDGTTPLLDVISAALKNVHREQ